jgi:hypothetical protein
LHVIGHLSDALVQEVNQALKAALELPSKMGFPETRQPPNYS